MRKNSAKPSAEQSEETAHPSGKELLKAIERIMASPEDIDAQAQAFTQEIRQKLPADASDAQIRQLTAQKLISHYANRAALAGGAASIPALVPGIGTMAAFAGGGLVDMTLCLKYEVEMVLSLSSLWGFDIGDPRERQLAYLITASHTYESTPGSLPIADLLKIELDAIWHYTPRQLGKLITTLFVKLAFLYSGKGLVRAIPLVGMFVAGGFNKALARRLGKSVMKLLELRPVPCDDQAASVDDPEDVDSEKSAPSPKTSRKKKPGKSSLA